MNVTVHYLELHLGKAHVGEKAGIDQEQFIQFAVLCGAERELELRSVERVIGISGIL